MAEAIAGIIVPELATLAAQSVVELLKDKYKAGKDSLSLADAHEVLNCGLKKLLALQGDRGNEVSRDVIQKAPSRVYMLWSDRVSDIEKQVLSLNKEYEGTKKYEIFKRRKLDTKIKRALSEVIELLEEELPKELVVDKLPEVIKEIGVPSIAEYETLQTAFRSILDLLEDKRVKCVALVGPKGVGKTTIMQHLNNHFYHNIADKEFDVVAFIDVAADKQIEDLHILQKIAKRINVDTECNEHEVARRIQTVLEKKRYLLILDGVRHAIDEIWKKLDISNHKKDSKVVITTHYPLVVESKICVDRKVNLEELSDKESLKMFRDIVGKNTLPPPLRLVCTKLCCRLPLIIDPIASSLKYQESPPDWDEALKKGWPFEEDPLQELYSILKTGYEQLDDWSKQKFFLFASLYPANSNIYTDYFVECCIVQGFLGHVDAHNKYSKKRKVAIEKKLRHLVNAALLVEGDQMRYVRMNDLYRKLALYISSKDSNLECKTFVDNEEPEETLIRSESWQHARWVSLVGSKRDNLPTSGNGGSHRRVLFLQKNQTSVKIPPTCFDNMGNLLILNLYGTKIRSLPSLSGLTSLKAFYLYGCLDLIISPPEIQPLQRLEVFDIRGTRVNFVPCLKSLRCLRIPYIASENFLGISKLDRLEELNIEVKSLPQECNGAAENIVQEVAFLENLTSFRCSFPSSKTLGKFLERSKSWRDKEQFTSFQFFVGCENSKHPKIIESFDDRIFKYVKYCNGEEKDDSAITEVLPQAEAFELICHKSVGSLLELVNTSSLGCLRGLLIEGCDQMSTVVAGDMDYNATNGTSPENEGLLPNLEQLHLENLQQLSIVFKGRLHWGSFSVLHYLTLKNCPELTSIFFKVESDDFPELQTLVVQNCSKIEVLIEVTTMERSILPKLKVLILDNLLNLKSICPNENLEWHSLKEVEVQKCPKLTALPFSKTNAANLRSIEGEKTWWSKLKWAHPEVRERFESAFHQEAPNAQS